MTARRVPERPGWWLIKADPLHSPDKIQHEVVRIRRGSGGLLIVGTSPNRVDQRPDIVWIAEIPSPAVLAALAEYGEALHAVDTRWDRTDDPDPNFRFHGAVAALQAAIRAERDGDHGDLSIWTVLDAARDARDAAFVAWQGAAEGVSGAGEVVRECKCRLRTRLVGDGCDVCNPELAAEYARQREATDGS